MENYNHIYYGNCPHFTVGNADQWSEQGYLFFENKVYYYEEDRKEQFGTTKSPMTITDFLIYAERHQIAIPQEFMRELKG